MRDQNCESCEYWLSRPTQEGGTEGLCRRYPPIAHTWVSAARGSADSVTMAQFPPMDARSWCGEWSEAGDAVLPLAIEQADIGAIAPPLAAAADESLPETDSIVFVETACGANPEADIEQTPEAAVPEAAAPEEVFLDAGIEEIDPFDAILQSDDTELWEDAARFGGAAAASATPPGDDATTEDPPADSGETPEVELQGASAEEPTGDQSEQTDRAARNDEDRNRSDIVLNVGDATGPGSADDAALVISRPASDDPHGQTELPDPAEWMNNYPDRSAGGPDTVPPRMSVPADPSGDGTDEWPDWSEWLESQADGELRLDRAVDRTIVEDLPIDDEQAGPGPVPEPPPWLNESQKPNLMGWTRRVWR